MLEGTIERILFAAPDGSFAAARLLGEDASCVVRGAMPGISEGMTVRAWGRWREHPRFGRQLELAGWEWIAPRSAEGVERFLAESGIPGLGEKTARRIVRALGPEALDRIDREPGCLAGVKGLKRAVRERIVSTWQEKRAGREALTFLYGLGLGPGAAGRVYKALGPAAPAAIREDPYRLAQSVWGIGFLTADRVARQLGIPADSPRRVLAGLAHLLEAAAGQGHCFLPSENLSASAERLLGLERGSEALAAGFALLARDPRFAREGTDVYLGDLWTAETELAAGLRARAGTRFAPAGEIRGAGAGPPLTGEQEEALAAAFTHGVTVITGGPGVGKTAVIRAIAEEAGRRGIPCALAAPTGRAAKRIEELTGHRATTLHLLLRFDPRTGGFEHGRGNELGAGLVVVDESSMVDVPLAWRLLQAVAETAPLVFVGDVDQLPSVGPGCFLRDLVASGRVPVRRLTRIFRQAAGSAIVANAHRVNRGEMPDLSRDGAPAFVWIGRDDPAAARRTAVELCAVEIPRRLGLDPWNDVQLLSPMQKGEAGVVAANLALQARLNPGEGGVPCGEYRLRPGDKVMQIQNNYEKGVFNGDTGRFEGGGEAGGEHFVRFQGRLVGYRGEELRQLTLAYACTIHKAQGSEVPAVVILLLDAHRILLARNLLYTAITRGKRHVILVGSRGAVRAAVENVRVGERFTKLRERLSLPGPR